MKKKQPELVHLKANHLEGQSSPYLLQHQFNPVDWYPWGEEALGRALKEDKPILVSIGYSACHWCHVMEKESFEDLEVAEIMNRDFVCIKVDREERPDIDHLYMTAVQLLTRQGGWPLNCFALPDTRPFWGGTYFPKDQWKSILMQVSELFKARRKDLRDQAQQLTEGIASSGFIKTGFDEFSPDAEDIKKIFENVMGFMDKEEGGTKGAPKFPLPVNHEFLLHYYYHTGEKQSLDQVELSLHKMAMGGIYDQIGGGFARYSTDETWKVPHFEKMLYDNAQLVSLYSHAWKISKKPLYRNVVFQTIEFVSRELTSPDGMFYSALDADSEGEEGKYYVWGKSEIDNILGKDASVVHEYYQVGGKGYWENGRNILLRDMTDESFARKLNVSLEEFHSIISTSNQKLLEARSKRVRPGLDHKVLTSWNALMINGLADAYAAFGENAFLDMAVRSANFIIKNAINEEGKLYRNLTGKKPSIDGFLEDYALFIQALIRLYEVSMKGDYLVTAKSLAEYVILHFSKPGTNYFSFSSDEGEKLQAEFYELPDNVIPASNSVMAVNLLYLSDYFQRTDWDERSQRMIGDISSQLLTHGISYSNWGRLMLHQVYKLYTIVVCGPEAGVKIKELNALSLPGILLAGSLTENKNLPIFNNRFRPGETWFYVCSKGNCRLPVSEIHLALEQIKP
jgi:uncharacterized protein